MKNRFWRPISFLCKLQTSTKRAKVSSVAKSPPAVFQPSHGRCSSPTGTSPSDGCALRQCHTGCAPNPCRRPSLTICWQSGPQCPHQWQLPRTPPVLPTLPLHLSLVTSLGVPRPLSLMWFCPCLFALALFPSCRLLYPWQQTHCCQYLVCCFRHSPNLAVAAQQPPAFSCVSPP